MRRWIAEAKRQYGGPGEQGELFNTANFQSAVGNTTNSIPHEPMAHSWLTHMGYVVGRGGCHWFESHTKANAREAELIPPRRGTEHMGEGPC